MITVDIPFRLPGANEYTNACRRNRFAGGKVKADYTQAVALYFRGLPPVQGPVKIRFTWHERTRRRDKDNVAFGKKFVLDGMQAAGFLPNDNNRWVVGFEDCFVYDGRDGVTVEVKMTTKEAGKIIEKAVNTYGPLMQMVVTIEELSELQKELTKCIRNGDLEQQTLAMNPALAEEMADVEIMLMQLYYMAGNGKTVDEITESKLKRLAKRIQAEG